MVGCRAMAGLCGLAKNVATSPQAAANDSHKPGIATVGIAAVLLNTLIAANARSNFVSP